MNTRTYKVKTLLITVLLSVTSITFALPTETEYQAVVAATGPYDDGFWGEFPIGFTFQFFENTYTDFYVTSNGLVMFGSGSNRYRNFPIPTGQAPNNYIAPFWDDLVIHSTGDIMYQTIGTSPNRKLVVQYNNMSFYGSPILFGTFQVILFEGSNNIQTQYRSIVDLTSIRASGSSATIGLENSNGSSGLTSSFNTAGFIQSEKALLYTPNGGSYTVDEDAVYEGVLLQGLVPRASTPNLVSPAYNSTVGDTVTFQWDAANNASSYYVVISQNSDLSSPLHTSADLTALSYEYILSPDQTYYWSSYSKNSEGTISWSEIWKFQTSSTPPLIAVPQTIYLEQGEQRELTLLFTGGDAGSKTATVTSLPAEGTLFQYNEGIPGAQILSVPTDVTDASFRLIYNASGTAGNGVGNFNFQFSDDTWTSPEVSYQINVSPPGIPNFLYASKETDRVEITFDRNMNDPAGKHLEFSIQDNGVDVSSSSCLLKPGDPTTIIVYVSPDLNTDHAVAVAYTKGTVTAESSGVLESFDFQLAGKFAQVINFDELADKTFGDADYSLAATSTSGLPVDFSSSNATVVTVSGTTVTVNGAGESLIYASQAGDDTYAAVTFERHQLVNQATATISISNLAQEYTGSGIQASVVTDPPGLNTKITYDLSASLPVDIGSFEVSVEIEEANYLGSSTATLVIADQSDPVPDLASLPDATGECSVSPAAPTATDLYAGSITGVSTEIPVTTQGTTQITWSFDDGNGNIATQTQNVLVNDITPPETPTLPDLSGECSVTAVAPTTTDNCAGTITGTTSDPLEYNSQGSFVITWNFDDGNGNSFDVNQNVLVADITPPEMPTLPDLSGECSLTAVAPTTTDACAGTITGTTSNPLVYSSQGSFVIIWNFNDGNGNSFNVSQNVLVDDLTPPVTPTLPDLSGECSVTAVAPTTTDACAGTITGTTSDPLVYNSQGSFVITWNFDDGNGNSIDVSQNVIVDDITPPLSPTLPDLSGECSVTAVAPTTTDACAGTITGTSSDLLVYDSQGSFVITWNFDDGNGNSIDVSQNILVADITPPDTPILPDLSGECSVNAVAPTTTDACVGIITGTSSDPLVYDSQGSFLITWNFDDGNGNSFDVSQNVLVADITPPETPTLPDLSDECSVTAVAPTTTDACAGTITGTTSDPLVYDSQGSFLITWNFDDGNGNSFDVNQNVLIADITPPSATSPADLITCDGTAESIGLSEVEDNCSTPTITYEMSGATVGTGSGDASGETFEPGVTILTYTLDDGNGNSAQYGFIITHQVMDEIVVSMADGSLTVETEGSYQWVYCENEVLIDGETGSTFKPGITGEYAVIVTQGVCSAVSQCHTLDYTGIDPNGTSQNFKVYPNPANNSLTLETAIENTNVTIKVMDVTGKIILLEERESLSLTSLDINRLKPGIYLVNLKSDQIDRVLRIIKE